MNIAILGAGNVGGTLAASWAKKGHNIFLALRNPDDPKYGRWNGHANVSKRSVGEAIRHADVVLVALPIHEIVKTLLPLGDLSAKVVIDATNSVFAKPSPYQHGLEALEHINKVKAAKGFNTMGFEVMADPRFGELQADMFTAGNNPAAKEVVEKLALDAGFAACHDFGTAEKVPVLEQLAMAWITLARKPEIGRNIAFKLLKR